MTAPLLLLLAFAGQDTVTLARAHEAALAHDPRIRQPALAAAATTSRIAGLQLDRKPQLALHAEATHQSAVTGLPITLPGVSVAAPPKDRFEAVLNVEQLLYDAGGREAQITVENSRLAETDASLATVRYAIHSDVNQAFFAAFTLQSRAADLDAVATDLASRLIAARVRVREGTGLPRDTAAIEAERLSALRNRDDALADRTVALENLSQLTGLPISNDAFLILPSLEEQVSSLTPERVLDSLRARPEFLQIHRSQARLDAESALTTTVNRPRLSAFGQAGFGRPGLNQFDRNLAGLWIAGVKLEWRPWTWNSAELNADALQAQRRSLSDDASELAEQLSRAATADLSRISRLREAVDLDARITVLRAVVEATARTQFDEGVITSAEYLTMRSALTEARLAEDADRAEVVHLEATLLTTLGLSLR